MSEKTACRCPTDWCRLEPANGAEYCQDLRDDEFCGYRIEDEPCAALAQSLNGGLSLDGESVAVQASPTPIK